MRNKILEALKTRFSGVDEKILGRIADKLAKTTATEEEVATVVEGVTFQQILESYGDSRATDATKSAVSNYEKKHGLKDGKPVRAEGAEDEGEEDEGEEGETKSKKSASKNSKGEPDSNIPAWAKALIDSNKELKDELTAMKQGKITDTRTAKFNKAIEGLSPLQKKVYGRVNLSSMSDEDFDTLMGEVADEVKEFAKESSGKGAAFQAPVGGTHIGGDNKEATDKELNAVIDRLKF